MDELPLLFCLFAPLRRIPMRVFRLLNPFTGDYFAAFEMDALIASTLAEVACSSLSM
jgi:hypothetical protein